MQQHGQRIRDIVSALLDKDSDLPAMSQVLMLINQLTSSEETPVTELATIILKDYALTNKVIRLVNTVTYAQFGEVTTISRAVTVMGYENIRNIALTLKVFEHLQKHAHTVELKDLIVRSVYSAILATTIAADLEATDKEEAFICALFHTFGKMIVASFLPEKYQEVEEYVRNGGLKENEAARSVMGVSFDDIGMGLAQKWNFPERIVSSMRKVNASEMGGRLSELDRLVGVANISNEISDILSTEVEQDDKKAEIEKLLKPYKRAFSALNEKIDRYIASSLGEIAAYSHSFNLNLRNSVFTKQMHDWKEEPPAEKDVGEPAQSEGKADVLEIFERIQEPEQRESPEGIFTKGIQEVNNSLFLSYDLNDIVRIVLETMYRGLKILGVSRVVFFIKDTMNPSMKIRFGFGSLLDELKRWFIIPLGESKDIFDLSISRQKDLIIRDIGQPDIQKLLPVWYRARVSQDTSVILLPISVNGKSIGLFYAEGKKDAFQAISGTQVNYLKILRDQTVLAITQKRAR